MRLTRRNFRICRRCRCDRWREHCEAWPAAKPRAVARVEHGVARAGARFPRNPADDAGPPEGRTRRPRRPFGRRCVRPQGERCCDRIGRWPGRAQYQRHASARLPPRSPARPDIVSGISATPRQSRGNRKERHEPRGDRNGHRRTKNRDRGQDDNQSRPAPIIRRGPRHGCNKAHRDQPQRPPPRQTANSPTAINAMI
jgi:hypothetical protein